ncbi:MAG: MAPEG family protein [Proteobacteria bacterium]|nr:MAPEG family protein [Pseudomonadota bacterium]
MNNLVLSFEYTSLVTIVTIFITLFFMFRTGSNRGKLKVFAPKTVGQDTWERYFRVHCNTVEQMVIFLPALWLAAVYSSDQWAGGIGAVWLVGRLLYSYQYIKAPKSRGPGMLLTLLPTVILAGIALFHIVKGMM